MTNVRKILCHAEFPCDRCGKLHLRMALATYNPVTEKIEGAATRVGQEICNDCNRADREKEKKDNKTYRQQLQWRKKKKFDHLLNDPKGGA